MRTFTTVSLVALLSLTAAAAAHAQAPTRAWIFVDCPPGAPVALSEAAQQRRALRGHGQQDHTVAPACRAALEAAGARLRVESAWLHALSADLDADALARVQALPFVRGLRPVARLGPQRAAPSFGPEALAGPALVLNCGASCAQLNAINAVAPLDRGINGRGVKVGFLDTEFGDFNHLVFARMRSEGRLGGTMNFTQGPQSDRHGLNTTSVAVGYGEGNLIGPGWGSTLYAATTEYAPTETNAEEDNFVRGLEWLEANGVDVVNASLGYTEFDPGQRSYTYANLNGNTGVTTRAADAAAARGVVMVVSAGNEGCASPSQCWYYIGTPADGDSVIAVGATTIAGAKASFSSFGPTADGRIKPDVSAPGVNVVVASAVRRLRHVAGHVVLGPARDGRGGADAPGEPQPDAHPGADDPAQHRLAGQQPGQPPRLGHRQRRRGDHALGGGLARRRRRHALGERARPGHGAALARRDGGRHRPAARGGASTCSGAVRRCLRRPGQPGPHARVAVGALRRGLRRADLGGRGGVERHRRRHALTRTPPLRGGGPQGRRGFWISGRLRAPPSSLRAGPPVGTVRMGFPPLGGGGAGV